MQHNRGVERAGLRYLTIKGLQKHCRSHQAAALYNFCYVQNEEMQNAYVVFLNKVWEFHIQGYLARDALRCAFDAIGFSDNPARNLMMSIMLLFTDDDWAWMGRCIQDVRDEFDYELSDSKPEYPDAAIA